MQWWLAHYIVCAGLPLTEGVSYQKTHVMDELEDVVFRDPICSGRVVPRHCVMHLSAAERTV